MLLSKRPDMFLPEQWPTYFSRARGCKVWDLDGNAYIDMSIMGIGTNILGYGHPEVDEAVQKTITCGNMSTLNCPEEVELAERLLELNPFAGGVSANVIMPHRSFLCREEELLGYSAGYSQRQL